MSTDIANVHLPPEGQDNSPLALIRLALEKQIPPDQMTALYNLSERYESNQAAKAFAEALTGFQDEMPPIVKANPVKKRDGTWMYNFASFDDVMAAAKPFLKKYGIVPTFTTAPAEGGKTSITCKIRVGTHAEDTTITLGLPGILNANDSQQAGGALSYGKRYALCAALNIVTTGEDKDGHDQFEGISDGQAEILNDLLETLRVKAMANKAAPEKWEKWVKDFWAYCGCTDMNNLRVRDFDRAKDRLLKASKA